jgi:hypothetical protein
MRFPMLNSLIEKHVFWLFALAGCGVYRLAQITPITGETIIKEQVSAWEAG